MRTLVFLAALLCSIAGAFVARAETTGDYGRPEEGAFVDEFLPWLKNGWGEITGTAVPAAPCTDDEITLRNRAYIILQPIELRLPSRFTLAGIDFVELWTLIKNEPAVYDIRSYGDTLVARPYRSYAARYAQLENDIYADTDLVGPFFATAQRVMDADGVRQRSFHYVGVEQGKIDMGQRRIEENRVLIAEVHRAFGNRIASYRYALETLLVLTPSPAAVGAEQALYRLEDRFRQVTALPAVAAGGIIRK